MSHSKGLLEQTLYLLNIISQMQHCATGLDVMSFFLLITHWILHRFRCFFARWNRLVILYPIDSLETQFDGNFVPLWLLQALFLLLSPTRWYLHQLCADFVHSTLPEPSWRCPVIPKLCWYSWMVIWMLSGLRYVPSLPPLSKQHISTRSPPILIILPSLDLSLQALSKQPLDNPFWSTSCFTAPCPIFLLNICSLLSVLSQSAHVL